MLEVLDLRAEGLRVGLAKCRPIDRVQPGLEVDDLADHLADAGRLGQKPLRPFGKLRHDLAEPGQVGGPSRLAGHQPGSRTQGSHSLARVRR